MGVTATEMQIILREGEAAWCENMGCLEIRYCPSTRICYDCMKNGHSLLRRD